MSQAYAGRETSGHARLARDLWRSPIGMLGLVARNEKLAAIFLNAQPQRFPFRVERTFGQSGESTPEPFRVIKQQLEEYFAGKRLVFRLPLDLEQGTPFQRRVWKQLQEIPYGRTVSYREVAESLGQPSAMRAVGGANGANPIPIVVPCHRVIAASGNVGGFSGGRWVKETLLQLESRTLNQATQLGMFRDDGTGDRPHYR